ncbi:MAG: U32 family peptidase [Treponema sp.]|jgi:putative protease|nr:U32 family peptidase [Treponema sp.]
MRNIELLAPAGSPEALDAAVAEGADAVYLGLKEFNARMRSANFAYAQFEGALRALHRMGRKLYVTVNTVFEQRESDRVYQLLKYLAGTGPDGVIVQDFGIITMARDFPGLRLHASTQMNIASARGANLLSRHGLSRAVLSRELTLEEIRGIGRGTNLELEVFVHGALCVSESGLCLFSSYLGGKSANRGMCTQACRRFYRARTGSGETSGYFFSPRDLSLVGRGGELAEAGVRSFKIEGRMKSAEYVGTVVSAYRLVIDSLDAGEDERRRALEEARNILRNDFARPKTEYFTGSGQDRSGGRAAGREAPSPEPSWLQHEQAGGTGISLGALRGVTTRGDRRRALVSCGLPLAAGDSLRFHRADDSLRQTHKLVFAEKKSASGDLYCISVPEEFGDGDLAYLIQTKAMTKRYPRIIPKDLSTFKRRPGRAEAPRPVFPRQGRFSSLPEGIYAAVARPEDLYVLQSIRPAGAIVPLNRKSARQLLDESLPFKPGELLPSLDPFFPQSLEDFYSEVLPALVEKGYRTFILNNPGHFSFFGAPKPKRPDSGGGSPRSTSGSPRSGGAAPRSAGGEAGDAPLLIAGPWLYTFNSSAGLFVRNLGAACVVSPFENNRQNLEKTWPAGRDRVFVTLFSRPSLFRIRPDLGPVYRFREFSGGKDENFFLVTDSSEQGASETLVVPEKPFSIVDKKPFLEKSGFRRFILDFSGFSSLKKHEYRNVMTAALEGRPLAGTLRFNWKNGFFQE